jgi:hypothetical protein
LEEVPEGRRRLAELALTACAGLVSVLTPRLAPFLSLVDRQRKSWLPRFVNLEPSITAVPAEEVLRGHAALLAGLPALMTVDLRETIILVRAPSAVAGPASLAAARIHCPSSSAPLLMAHSPNPSPGTSTEEA